MMFMVIMSVEEHQMSQSGHACLYSIYSLNIPHKRYATLQSAMNWAYNPQHFHRETSPSPMEVCFLASGEHVAVLDAADIEGKAVRDVKRSLVEQLGVTRFRQRFFLEAGWNIPYAPCMVCLATKLVDF